MDDNVNLKFIVSMHWIPNWNIIHGQKNDKFQSQLRQSYELNLKGNRDYYYQGWYPNKSDTQQTYSIQDHEDGTANVDENIYAWNCWPSKKLNAK